MNIKHNEQEKYYFRNRIALLFEGFFVVFSFSAFSQTTILPVYVSNITANPFWISMLTLMFFGLSNMSSVFSSIIGVNAKSPKKTAVIICGLQRVCQLLIYFSTYYVTQSETAALLVFFSSYFFYSISVGMASPVFSNMVSKVIYKNVSSFYGSYSLAGGLAGIISAQLIKIIERKYGFPLNYRYLFLSGVTMAVIATLIVIFGVKEVPDDTAKNKIFLRDFPGFFKDIIKNNFEFRQVLVLRIFMAIAESSIPFFIIKVGTLSGIHKGYTGTMTTVLLVFNLIFSKMLGYIGDRKGPIMIARIGCLAGVGCTGLGLLIQSPQLAYLMFALVSLATLSTGLSNNVSVIVHSPKGLVPIYAAVSGLCIAPFYGLSSVLGGIIVKQFNYSVLFGFSLCFYLLGLILFSKTIRRRLFSEKRKT